MNFLRFKWNFRKLKKQYNKVLKAKENYLFKNAEKKKFVNFFIKDEEDKILNKKVLSGFDKQIQKCKLIWYKHNHKLNKILFKLRIIDLNYIDILYKFNISEKDSQIIKEIFKNRVNS